MSDAYRFGPFQLRPEQRQLTRDGLAVALGGRAFDLLEALLRRHERVVTKDELIDTVWAGRVVEENNLQVQIAALRRVLGGDAILTVPGRGYRFGLPVQAEGVKARSAAAPAGEPVPDLIGREHELSQLGALLDTHALVTLAGPGGIGKTRLARALLQARPGGAWIDLAACRDAAALQAALVEALGAPGGADAGALLMREPRLLVLDALGGLVDRSLVVTDGAEPPRYRLLESARLFSRSQLDTAGETPGRLRRHARATIDTLRETIAAWRREGTESPWRQLLRAALDNVRAACHWAEREADLALGIELAEAAGWSFAVLNLHVEYLAMAERWLDRLDHAIGAPADQAAVAALRLRVVAVSKNSAHPAGLKAALGALPHYRRVGDDRRRHECLLCAVAIGARRGAALPFADMLAEARGLQRPDWPRPPIANYEWARDTWLISEGR